jgi:hypothetical protein
MLDDATCYPFVMLALMPPMDDMIGWLAEMGLLLC